MPSTPRYREATPAYQEYGADMLANRCFRLMTLEQRGFLYTLRLECWVNGSVPCDPKLLARMLAIDRGDVVRLIVALEPFLEAVGNTEFRFADLERYRREQMVRREKLKGGAAATNSKRWADKRSKSASAVQESPSESPGVSLGDAPGESPLRGEERSRDELKGKASSGKGNVQHDEWLAEYDTTSKSINRR
jgi:hypothetical protein